MPGNGRFDNVKILVKTECDRSGQVGYVKLGFSRCRDPFTPHRRVRRVIRPVRFDQGESRKLARRQHRRPMSNKFRACNRIIGVVTKFSRRVTFGFQTGITDGNIGLACIKVEDRAGSHDIKPDIGMGVAPELQARHQPACREFIGRCHPQLAVSLNIQPLQTVGKPVKARADRGQKLRALWGQRQGSRSTPEQRFSAKLFQRLHLMADGRRRQAQFLGGLLEA